MEYVIQPRDTLSSIARRFDTTVERLESANHHIQNPEDLFPGQSICIPSWATHRAQEGETLSSIAQRFGTTPDTLAAANPDIEDPNIPLAHRSLAVPFLGVYTVETGDTLSELGSQFGVAWDTLFEANCDVLRNPQLMFPGQLLAVPAESVAA